MKENILKDVELSVYEKLLETFQPILVLYMPDEMLRNLYTENKVVSTVAKIKEETGNKYFILVIPTSGDDVKIDLLSVVKSEFVTDKDLELKIKKLQESILNDFKGYVTKSNEEDEAFYKMLQNIGKTKF